VQLAHVNLLHCLEILFHAKDLSAHKQAHCCPNRWTREIGRPKPMAEHEMNWCTEAKGIGNKCESLLCSFQHEDAPLWMRF
jgi:hypothetical protein